MDIFRRSGTIETILPMHWTTNPIPQPSDEPANITENPVARRSLLQRLPRINTTVRRHGSDALIMSPAGTTASPVEAADLDATFDQMVLEEKKIRIKKLKSEGKIFFEEEKPGEGNVWDVWARLPTDARRRDMPKRIPVHHVPLPAGSIFLNCPTEELPEGWTMHIHPGGKPYYYRIAQEPEPTLLVGTNLYGRGKEVCRPLEIVTDSDPRASINRKTLEHAHFIARITIAENNIELPERVELFLELYPADEPDLHPYAGYYLVDHTNQGVFWGAATSTGDLGASKINPKTFSDQHLKLQLRHQYWSHIDMYPLETSIVSQVTYEELLEQLSFVYVDAATSQTSTSVWSEEQCQRFLSILHQCPRGRKTWLLAHLMSLITLWQFQNFYGHPAVRLDFTHSIAMEVAPFLRTSDSESGYSKTDKNVPLSFRRRIAAIYTATGSIALQMCCVLMLYAPLAYERALGIVWVDNIVNKARFRELIDRTIKDWGDVSLLSTVLWAANMAFLAIPYPIFNPQLQDPVTAFEKTLRVAMITASICSVMLAIGSIALSLLHMQKHRRDSTVDKYCDFLGSHPLYGHRPLAIIWSIPYALLMWGVVAFTTAIMFLCVATAGIVTGTIFLILCCVVVGSILICVWYFWEQEPSMFRMWLHTKIRFWKRRLTNWLQRV